MISGSASSPATVQKVYWTTDSSKTTASWTGWNEAEGTDYWNFTVKNLPDGSTNKVYIAAVDSIGNKTTKKEYTLKVDSTAPSVAPKYYQIGSGTIQDANGTIYVNKQQDLTVYGTFQETISNPSTITFAIDDGSGTVTSITPTSLNYSDVDITSGVGSTSFDGTEIDENTKSWKAVIAQGNLKAGGLVVTATNGAELENKNTELAIQLDTTAPKIGDSVSISKSSVDETGGHTDYYYVNNGAKTTISGTVEESNILSVKVVAKCGSNTLTKTPTNLYNWSVELDMTNTTKWKNNTNGTSNTTVTITATDKAGNSKTRTLHLIFDTTPPEGLHQLDANEDGGKDIYFRVGDQENDDITSSSTNPQWSDTLDKDVGGKYKPGTFGNKETIKIRGNFKEEGSGVSMIYYKLSTTPPTTPIDADDVISTADGYFAPKPATETNRRVFYTGNVLTGGTALGSTGKYYKEIASDYITTISGFQEGTNYLVLVAEDKVGNRAVDVVSEGVNYYTINVDTLPPETTALSGTQYSNKSNDLKLSFTVEDKINKDSATPAGIKKVTVSIQGVTAANNNKTATLNSSTGKYEVTFPKTQLPGTANNATSHSISVTTVDKAGVGNSDTRSIGTLVVDQKKPTVEIGNIPDADISTTDVDVNGTITISGTASDETKLSKVTAAYKKKEGSDSWHSLTVNGTNNWSASFDTTADGVADNTVYTIRAIATDSAGNTLTVTKDVKVNQDSDRPVVKFTNLTKDDGKFFLKYGNNAKLEGTITDDDATSSAVVEVFKASSSQITSSTTATTGTTTFNAATGDYSFQPANTADGEKTVYFYIKDNKGNEFYTNTSTATGATQTRPKQQYKTDAPADNNKAIKYKSDSNAPTINSVELQTYTAASGGTGTTPTSLGASCIVGGSTKNFIDLTVSAKDGNGIKGIVIELSQNNVTKRYRSNTDVGESADTTASPIVAATEDIDHNHIFTIPRLNLSQAGFTQNSASSVNDVQEGKVTVKVYVYDNSGLYSNQESLFVIDNTAPVLNITAPKNNGEIVYATQSNTVGGNVEATDVKQIDYTVSLSATQPTTGWNTVTNAKLSATLIFDGDVTSTENGFHSNKLRKWLENLLHKTEAEINAGSDDRVDMYVWFKVTDECGNAGYSCRQLSVYPNGDKPVIELVYPENKADGSSPYLAGTIRVYGYATVPVSTITATYVQIDPNYNGTTFAEDWETRLSASEISSKATYSVEQIGTTGKRGIKASGTQNWNLPINGNNEFNVSSGSRRMAIRIYALSETNKVNEDFVQEFYIDPNAPHIGGDGTTYTESSTTKYRYPLQIVEFASAEDAKNIANNQNPTSYKSEMWIKGQKYLIASVYDDAGIKTLTLDQNINGVDKLKLVENGVANSSVTLQGGGKIIVTQTTCGYSGKKNFNICIPLPTTSGSGNINWQLEATEDGTTNNSCTETIKLNYDNNAPRISSVDHSKYQIDADIHQSQGFYNFNGFVSDAEGSSNVSGVMGVAFYFMRRGSANTRVYDPMYENKSVAVRTGNTDASNIIYSHGLYWKQQTITRDSNDLTKLTLTTPDENIHTGGLALLGGTIYRISNVTVNSTTKKTEVVYLEDQVPITVTTGNFALALVVDNLSKKETITNRSIITTNGYGYGYYSSSDTADDGDLMVEDWNGTSIEGQWTAIINSANIPDGPIELHYVAFDKSQNFTVGIVGNVAESTYNSYPTLDVTANKAITGAAVDTTEKLVSKYYYSYTTPAYISNNAPRIAGVTVGCDYDGSGTISDSEKRTEYYKTDQRLIGGNITDVITDVTKKFIASSNGNSNGGAMMVVKDKINVQLEIIGGNGDLYYQWNIDSAYKEHSVIAANTSNPFTPVNTAMSYTQTTNEGLTEDNYYITSKLPAIDFSVAQLQQAVGGTTSGSNKVCWWTIEIWDSTEETTKFTTSQYAELKLPLDVQILDNTAPKTVISDLYWNSATDNSVYKDVNDDLYGHIELKGDLETGTGKLGNASLYGSEDDKISGIVVFKGFAYDNKRLSSLKWAIVDHVANNTYTSPTYLFPATNGALQNGATFSGGSWTGTGTLNTNHYKFEVSDAAADGAYLDEKGHKVAWTLTVDTSYIKNVVEKDARLYIYAQDTNSKTTTITNTEVTSNSTNQETYDNTRSRPTYQIDIVPYITGVTTRLAEMNTPDPVIYSRTAQGHYPIATNETSVVLKGFNLAQNNADVTLDETDITALTTGAYAYTVRTGITTINNLNNNDAHGSYNINATGLTESKKVANMYNRQPNTTTNLTLTDDVYFDMWELKDGAQGNGGKIKEPIMRINPANNVVGFAFASGAAYFSMPGQTNSFELWQRNYADYNGIAMAYDYNGYAHTLATGLDTAPSNNYAGRMNYTNSAFGHKYGNWPDFNSQGYGNFTRRTQIALESIGGGGILDQERFSDVAIAVGSLAAGFPTVYVAYCDTNTNQIRFRYGTIDSTSRYENSDYNNFGQLDDSKSSTGGTIQDTDNGDNYGRHGAFEAHTDYYSLIAGGTTGNTAGNYVSLDVIPGKDNSNNHSANNDVVVVVWADGSKLNYMYRFGTKNDTNASSDGVANYWSKPITIATGKAEYCKVKVDPVGGIHIAWFDRTKSDLKYAYMSSYNSAYTGGAYNGTFDQSKLFVTTVDAYSQIGSYLDIDVGRKTATGNVIPYISYFADGMNSLPKFAYLPDGIDNTSPVVPNGADASTNLYTGSWEMSLIPTLSDVRSDNINIALWKNRTNGVINYNPTVANTITAVDPTATGSTVLPNGQSEVIVGYATVRGTTGYIETAQRK